MKRILSLVLAIISVALVMVGFCACDGSSNNNNNGGDGAKAGTFGIVYKNVVVELDKNAKSILSALGAPEEEKNVADCGTGPRKRYTYNDIEIYTVEVNGTEKIDEINLTNDLISTSKGISIGSSEADVREAYGNPSSEANGRLIYSKSGLELIFNIKNGEVGSIKYNKRA